MQSVDRSVHRDRYGSMLGGGEEKREGVGVKKADKKLVGLSGSVIKNLPHGGTRPAKIALHGKWPLPNMKK